MKRKIAKLLTPYAHKLAAWCATNAKGCEVRPMTAAEVKRALAQLNAR